MKRLAIIFLLALAPAYGIRLKDLPTAPGVDKSKDNLVIDQTRLASDPTRLISPSSLIEVPDYSPSGAWDFTGTLDIGSSPVPEPRFPVFILNPPDDSFTDFEIKATRTNFGANGSPTLAYYFHSPGSLGSEKGDKPDVWFTDSGASDSREYQSLDVANNDSIASSLAADGDADQMNGVVVVVTDSDLAGTAREDALIWTVRWWDSSSGETDADGDAVWRPVQPDRYIETTFNP